MDAGQSSHSRGGLGVQSVVMLAPSAFLSSAAATLVLQSAILGGDWPHADASVGHIRDIWCHTYSATLPSGKLVSKQKHWDTPAVSECRAILVSSVKTPLDRARLLAVASPHAGDWLKAFPIASCGLRLEDEAIRVSVGLRLGLPIFKPHTCVCGAMVDERGLHGLSCMRGIGRLYHVTIISMTSCVVPLPALECRLWRNRLVLSPEQNFARMAWRWYHGPRANVLRGMSPWSTLLPRATSIIRSM